MDGPRACLESEFDEVISLVNSIFRPGSDQDIRTDYPLVFDTAKLEYMRIIKVDGKVVSHVPVAPREVVANGDRFMIGIISPTATHPDYRHRGYATHCLRDCVRIMEERDRPVSVLWTRETTFPFYQNSGWEAVRTQAWAYTLNPHEYEVFERGVYDIVLYNPANPQHLEAVISLHDSEPYRIVRSPEEYRILLQLPRITTLLATKDQQVVAYLMVGRGSNKPGMIEAGGEVDGVEALVNSALLLGPDNPTQVVVPITSTGLGQLMEAKKPDARKPVEEAEGVGFQMMRVNSLAGLLGRIENHLQRKATGLQGHVCLVCSDSGEAVTLRFGDGSVDVSPEKSTERIELSRRQLVRLIFGPHPAADPIRPGGKAGEILDKIFPFYFPVWELDHS